jgi:hypothetical protein
VRRKTKLIAYVDAVLFSIAFGACAAATPAVVHACVARLADRGTTGTPKETIKLFNGKDLTNFYTYLRDTGKNNDPKKVFTVADGMIRISGEIFGGLVTEKEFENYHLLVEFKWGDKTWGGRERAARDSGVLVHAVGGDGAAGGNWLESVECQMIEGGTGDLILVAGKNKPSIKCEVEKRETFTGKKPHLEPYYKPGGTLTEFKSGRINWYGRDPHWTDTLGFRGKDDVEHTLGQWNTLEVVCAGSIITNILNGTVVNKGVDCSHTRGKILFQSEGAEVFFRRIELRPLNK